MPSNWRSPPRPEEKSSEQGRSYNRLNREIDRRREGAGWVRVASKRGNARGAKEPCFVCNVSDHKEGKDEMTKASIDLQDLRRRIYVKAKAETSWKFWGLYVHVCKLETLREAYALAKRTTGLREVTG